MQGTPVSTVSHDGAIIRGSGQPGFHTDHFYTEIPPPPPPMELQQEHFHIHDLKGLDYRTHEPTESLNYKRGSSMEPPPPLSSSSGLQSNRKSYGAAFNTSESAKGTFSTNLSTQVGKMGGGHSKIDDLDLDIYARMRSPTCICSKQVTIHVVIMFLAGIVYLAVGGIAGFYFGKTCKYKIL